MNQKLEQIFQEINELVEPKIEELLLDSVDPKNKEIVMYQMSAGGKRIRPVLLMLGNRLLGGKDEDAVYPAAAIEILHNYTLIVDDRMDHSEFRRNAPTVWKKYGISISDCIAAYYPAAIFRGLKEGKDSTKLIGLFASSLNKVNDGQILDILFERKGRDEEPFVVENRFGKITKDDYLKMIKGKTASLYSACFEAAAIANNTADEVTQSLKDFGLNLGLAFQIRDDILDTFGDQEKVGKEIGKDIKERKGGNIVTLLALEKMNEKDGKIIEEIFNKDNLSDKDVRIAIDLIEKTDAKKEAEEMANDYIQKAKINLRSFPQNEWTEMLSELADFIVNREK